MSTCSSLFTIVGVATVAYALCDLVHEAAGHGFAALMTPDVRLVSLSTVALQTTRDSRVVAAAGSMANLAAGIAAISVFHRSARFSPAA